MLLDQFTDIITYLIYRRKSSREIENYLRDRFGALRGIGSRQIRRYIEENDMRYRPNNNQLLIEVGNSINQVGSYYGRRMLTGTLRAQGIQACEVRVRAAMMLADPVNYARRQVDIARRFNPVPYNAQYFGHKLHIDLNEKLIHYGCIVVGAIDGFSGMVVSLFTIHRKNCIDLNKMYTEILLKFGIWDQIRVDQGIYSHNRKLFVYFNEF